MDETVGFALVALGVALCGMYLVDQYLQRRRRREMNAFLETCEKQLDEVKDRD